MSDISKIDQTIIKEKLKDGAKFQDLSLGSLILGIVSLFIGIGFTIYSIKQTNESEIKIKELSDKLLKLESKFDSVTEIQHINDQLLKRGIDQLMEYQRKPSKKK